MPKKYISAEESEYNDYPDYLEGTLVKDKNMYYFEFPYTKLPYYKKYMNGDKKGDYEEFLKNDFTTPEDIVITEEGIIQNDSGGDDSMVKKLSLKAILLKKNLPYLDRFFHCERICTYHLLDELTK